MNAKWVRKMDDESRRQKAIKSESEIETTNESGYRSENNTHSHQRTGT